MQIFCDHAQLGKNKKIYCDVTTGLCGHVYYCQLSCKWKQTGGALDCALRRKEGNSHLK